MRFELSIEGLGTFVWIGWILCECLKARCIRTKFDLSQHGTGIHPKFGSPLSQDLFSPLTGMCVYVCILSPVCICI